VTPEVKEILERALEVSESDPDMALLTQALNQVLEEPGAQEQRFQRYYRALEQLVEHSNPGPKHENNPLRFFMSPEAKRAGIAPPERAYQDDAGFDLRLLASEPLVIAPHSRVQVPTGVGFEIPSGWYGLVCNRTSGGKRGLVPLAQVVDASYTGFLNLTLHNTNDKDEIIIEPGERCAQIVFMPTWNTEVVECEPHEVKNTDRGSGAYGSSGKH